MCSSDLGIVTNLGTDLTNDHPIGIQYCGGGPNASSDNAACKDPDFKNATNDLKNTSINGTTVWWVDTSSGTAGTREKTDMILYTRSFAGTDGPSVECASCHDPHSTNQTFLRISNAQSAVCLACHVK